MCRTELFEAPFDETIDAIRRVAHRTAEAIETGEDKALSASLPDVELKLAR